MGGSSRSSTSTTNNAYDNRSFTTVNNNNRTDIRYDNRTDIRYDIDNSVRNEIDYRYDIDNSVRNDYRYDIDNSVRNDVRNDYEIDNSTNITDAYNTTVGEGAIYAAEGAEVTVNETYSDLGAIEAAFGFARDVSAQAVGLSQNAMEEAFKSTVGGLQDQQNKWMATVSGMAVLAVAATAFSKR